MIFSLLLLAASAHRSTTAAHAETNSPSNTTTIYVPNIERSIAWETALYVRNNYTASAAVTIYYYNAAGSQITSQSYNLAANSSTSATPPGNFTGSAKVVGTKDISVAVLVEHITTPYSSGAYEGVEFPGIKSIIPLVHRNNNGWNNEIFLQNTSASGTASVTLSFNAQPGTGNNQTYNYTLAPRETRYLVTSSSSFSGLGSLFIGSAEVTSDLPVAVVYNQFASSFSSMIQASNAPFLGSDQYAPLVQNSNANYFAGFSAQNLTDAGNLAVTYYHSSGSICANSPTYSNWPVVVNPIPPAGNSCGSVASAKFDGDDGRVLVPLLIEGVAQKEARIYTTGDGGASWVLVGNIFPASGSVLGKLANAALTWLLTQDTTGLILLAMPVPTALLRLEPRSRMKKMSLILLAMLLVLSACQSSPTPTPSISPEIASSPISTEILPTPTFVTEIPYPYPPPTSASPPIRPEYPTTDPLATPPPLEPTVTPEPFYLSKFWFARLLDAQHGWVISEAELMWTDDAGHHWRQMMPTGIGEGIIQNAFFLDPQRGWGLVCDPQPSGDLIKITFTSDGGSTWEMKEIAIIEALPIAPTGHCSQVHLFFLTAQQGWLLVDRTQMHNYVGEMFQTLDGGQTWQHLGVSPSGEFLFVSDTHGWMLADSFGPKPLYRTDDGGQTWQMVSVNGSDGNDDFFLPVFFDEQTGIVALILRGQEGSTEGVTFFKTQDGGESWSPVGKLSNLPPESLGFGSNSVQIWDEQTWVVAAPHYGVYWTLDGGQNWVENTNEMARSINKLVTLGSATSGWGWTCDPKSEGRCVFLLMATEDMGAHWEKLEVQP